MAGDRHPGRRKEGNQENDSIGHHTYAKRSAKVVEVVDSTWITCIEQDTMQMFPVVQKCVSTPRKQMAKEQEMKKNCRQDEETPRGRYFILLKSSDENAGEEEQECRGDG
jgi:hypothetical protein